jgi:hypothetical protein
MVPRSRFLDLAAILTCTLAWGTTWFVITFQLGVVDPVVSLTYRFALATALLFGWCAVRALPLRLSAAQHAAACGIGFFTFGIDYTLIYLAEARISSAVVAVMFATLALVNLVMFRVAFAQRAPLRAWGRGESGRRGRGHALPELTPPSLRVLSLPCASGVLGSAEPARTRTRFRKGTPATRRGEGCFGLH